MNMKKKSFLIRFLDTSASSYLLQKLLNIQTTKNMYKIVVCRYL